MLPRHFTACYCFWIVRLPKTIDKNSCAKLNDVYKGKNVSRGRDRRFVTRAHSYILFVDWKLECRGYIECRADPYNMTRYQDKESSRVKYPEPLTAATLKTTTQENALSTEAVRAYAIQGLQQRHPPPRRASASRASRTHPPSTHRRRRRAPTRRRRAALRVAGRATEHRLLEAAARHSTRASRVRVATRGHPPSRLSPLLEDP